MNRLEAWLLHASTVALAVTGIAYAWMRYILKPVDPFSVVNHPLEPHMLSSHILVAPLLLVGFGVILHSHILFKIAAGAATARRSGLILIPTFVVMVLSGYLLQVVTSDFRKVLVAIHLGSGILWIMLYAAHQVASFAQRRMRSNGKSRTRFPVQVLLIAVILTASTSVDAAPFERHVHVMGTTLRLLMLDEDHSRALKDTEALIQVIEDVDNQLSTWKQSSELSLLNHATTEEKFPVSRTLLALIREVQNWTLLTKGAFDPGIGRLIEAWGVHKGFRIPTKQEISDALNQSGIRHLSLDEKNLTITKRRNILIDPGAFGKGEALDRAIALARAEQMAPVLLDFGGQISVHGIPAAGEWISFIANPEDRFSRAIAKLSLKTGSLATSGYSERSGVVANTKINHILNPATGLPAEQYGSVTVWHSHSLEADILSTALYVMGSDAGYKWAKQMNIAAVFVMKDRQIQTPLFIEKFIK